MSSSSELWSVGGDERINGEHGPQAGHVPATLLNLELAVEQMQLSNDVRHVDQTHLQEQPGQQSPVLKAQSSTATAKCFERG